MMHFMREVDFLVRHKLHGAAATMLVGMGIPFEEAYYLIFKKMPTK